MATPLGAAAGVATRAEGGNIKGSVSVLKSQACDPSLSGHKPRMVSRVMSQLRYWLLG